MTLVLVSTSCQDVGRGNSKADAKAGNIAAALTNCVVRRFSVQIPYEGDVFEQNVYLLFDKTAQQGLIIDPGSTNHELETEIARSGITIKGILNTHGHFDHTGANGVYARKYQAKVYAHVGDKQFYQRTVDEPTRWIAEECTLRLGDFQVQVIHTPGHSSGSVCFLVANHLFSGDTLFQGTVGRTDYFDGDPRSLANSLAKLTKLPEETSVYPGHGEMTVIGVEKRTNPFCQLSASDAETSASEVTFALRRK